MVVVPERRFDELGVIHIAVILTNRMTNGTQTTKVMNNIEVDYLHRFDFETHLILNDNILN